MEWDQEIGLHGGTLLLGLVIWSHMGPRLSQTQNKLQMFDLKFYPLEKHRASTVQSAAF